VADEPNNQDATGANDDSPAAGGRQADPRYFQRNLAERLFPGPTGPRSRQAADHIQGLLRPLEDGTAAANWRGRASRTPSTDRGSRQVRPEVEAPLSPVVEPTAVATPEDIDRVRETLEQQNELLRALLASSVDTQEDARSTAQNSRTFAWAGTAIALLTLIATVISIVAAIRA
jgi:hypothetical protein